MGNEPRLVRVVQFNVEHGDSLLIGVVQGAETTWGLVDCCQSFRPGWRNEDPTVLQFIKDNGITALAFVCITHVHYDHYRGLSKVLTYFTDHRYPIRSFWASGAQSAKTLYALMKRHAERLSACPPSEREHKGITEHDQEASYHQAQEWGDIITWLARASDTMVEKGFRYQALRGIATNVWEHGGLTVHCLAPVGNAQWRAEEHLAGLLEADPARVIRQGGVSANIGSVVLYLMYGEARLLFAGDANLEAWDLALPEIRERFGSKGLRAHLCKLGHHGARDSTTRELCIELLDAHAHVVISACSHHDRRSHPHAQTLDTLRALHIDRPGLQVYCTNAPRVCRLLPPSSPSADRPVMPTDVAMLLQVLPGHGAPQFPAPDETACFGEMEFAVSGDPVMPVHLARSSGPVTQCRYLRATGSELGHAKGQAAITP